MTLGPARRMVAFEQAFLEVIWSLEEDVRATSAPDIFRRDREEHWALFAPIGALLIAELVDWQVLGLNRGFFEGEPRFRRALNRSEVLKLYNKLPRAHERSDNERRQSHNAIQDSLVAAVEDLTPERLEFVRLLVAATDDEFGERIGGLYEVAELVASRSPGEAIQVGEVDWALSGRESTLGGWSGPAGWRSNESLQLWPRFQPVHVAAEQVAIATLISEAGGQANYGEANYYRGLIAFIEDANQRGRRGH